MKTFKPENNKTNELSIFHQPTQSQFIARILYYSFFQFWKKYLRDDSPLKYFCQTLILILFLIFFSILSLGFRFVDIIRVYQAKDYDRPSQVYGKDKKGNVVHFATFSLSTNKVIKLEKKTNGNDSEMPKIVSALLVSEDINYYQHFGIDLIGILRAMVTNFISGEIREGASTISQQVARLRFLKHEKTYLRKIREMFLAFLLEGFHSKHKILEDYLNMVPLGHGTYGVGAATNFYFNKDFRELTWGESAVIAALTTRPQEFSPILNPRNSMRKVKSTLHKLIAQEKISIAEAEAEYRNLQINYYRTLNRSPNDTAFHKRLNRFPYATAYVYDQLPKKFKKRQLYTNGYRIYTTINPVYQQAAQDTVLPYLRDLSKRTRRPPFHKIEVFDSDFEDLMKMSYELFDLNIFINRQKKKQRDFKREFSFALQEELYLLGMISGDSNLSKGIEYQIKTEQKLDTLQNIEGALISIVPQTGEIAAVIGGSEYSSGNRQLRFKSIRRQPGSAFKPLIVAAALQLTAERQKNNLPPITAASIFNDTPLHFLNQDLSEFSPNNYSKEYSGKMTLRKALTKSKNSIAIQVYQEAGVNRVNRFLEILLQLEKDSLREDFTLPLGTLGVSPLQLARTFGIFANGGIMHPPYLIEKITDSNDKVLYVAPPREAQVILDPTVAHVLTSMLTDVLKEGTGRLAYLVGRDTAGKTGTTNNNTNAWFAGYVKQMVTVLYLGYDTPHSMGPGATGGGFAAPLWGRYMLRALRSIPNKALSFPTSKAIAVEICEETGQLPSPSCKETRTELFLPSTVPTTSLIDINQPPVEIIESESDFFYLKDIE